MIKGVAAGGALLSSAAAIQAQRGDRRFKFQTGIRANRKDFLQDRYSNYGLYVHNQNALEMPIPLIEENLQEHARKYDLPEKMGLGVEAKGSLFGGERVVPLLEKRKAYILTRKDSEKDPLSLALPIPKSSDSKSRGNFFRRPFGSITSSTGSRRNPENGARFDNFMLTEPRDRKAVNEAIDRYRAGKPVREQQQYRVVTEFDLPSQFQLNPAGELLTISLWVVFIVSLVFILRTLFIVLARVWRSSPNSSLQNRLGLLQGRQLELLSDQQLRDRAQNLQRGAIETYLAHRAGKLSRAECRRIMVDCYLVLPPIVDMMLDWVDSGKPLPKAIDESFTRVVTKDTVAGSSRPTERLWAWAPAPVRPSVQPFLPLPPPPPLVQPFPSPPPPPLPPRQTNRAWYKSVIPRIKINLGNRFYPWANLQLLFVSLIVLIIAGWLLIP